MRYKVRVYTDEYKNKLIDLTKDEKGFNIPPDEYLKGVILCVIDTKTDKMVAFVAAVTGESNTAYLSHLILDKGLRKTKNGYYVLKLLMNYLEMALGWIKISAYEGFVAIDNKIAKNLYDRRGGKCISHGYLYRKEINNV